MMRFIFLACVFVLSQARSQTSIPLWKTLPDVPALPRPDDSGRIVARGAKLYYADFNRVGGDPVLLLHGGFGNSEIWGFEVPLMAANHRVIVMDTRGHGRSSMTDEPFSYAIFASDVIALLDSLHIPDVSIVGWSDGGITGLVLAMYYPRRVNKLFTYGANFNASGEKHAAPDTAMFAKFMAGAKASYARMSPTPGGFAQLRKALSDMYAKEPDLDTNAIKKIIVPTVIGCGEYEQFYTREHFQELAALIPGARLVVMPHVGHGGPIQDPKKFHKVVSLLLEQKKVQR